MRSSAREHRLRNRVVLLLCVALTVACDAVCGPPKTSRPDPIIVSTGATKETVENENGKPDRVSRSAKGRICDDEESWIYSDGEYDREFIFCGNRLARIDEIH